MSERFKICGNCGGELVEAGAPCCLAPWRRDPLTLSAAACQGGGCCSRCDHGDPSSECTCFDAARHQVPVSSNAVAG